MHSKLRTNLPFSRLTTDGEVRKIERRLTTYIAAQISKMKAVSWGVMGCQENVSAKFAESSDLARVSVSVRTFGCLLRGLFTF